MKAQRTRAFTLLELLVVVGLIGVMSFFLLSGMIGGGAAAALQAGQATMANLITVARTKAPATGRKTRLLINTDAASPERYLRYIALQLARQAGSSPADWDTITTVTLPEGVYIVPSSLTQTTGLVDSPANWRRMSDPSAEMVSDLFANQSLRVALAGDAVAQNWTGVAFTATGTLAAVSSGTPPKGFLVITLGTRKQPGSYLSGEAPVRLINPQAVRGLVLSAYGVPALLNDRRAF